MQTLNQALLFHIVRQSGCANRLGAYTENHGQLVDDKLGAAKVVITVAEHIRALEFAPLHVAQVEAPDDWCHLRG